MENQNPAPQNSQPPSPPSGSPTPNPAPVNPSQIYPDATKSAGMAPINTPKTALDPTVRRGRPPLGVIIISALIIIQASLGLFAGSHQKQALTLVIDVLELILGIGLLTLHETARLIYVWLGIISLVLEVPSLLFLSIYASSSTKSHSGIYLLIICATLAIQIFILVYLTRPSIKGHFS